MKKYTCIILDANAILRGSVLNLGQSTPVYTTSLTMREIKNRKKSLEMDTLLEVGILRVIDANRDAKILARKLAQMSRDIRKLSNTDIDLIALALHLKDRGELPLVLTSDYAIQNVLSMAEIDFKAVGQRNIRKTVIWKYQCPVCKKIYEASDICPLCGARLVKRARTLMHIK